MTPFLSQRVVFSPLDRPPCPQPRKRTTSAEKRLKARFEEKRAKLKAEKLQKREAKQAEFARTTREAASTPQLPASASSYRPGDGPANRYDQDDRLKASKR